MKFGRLAAPGTVALEERPEPTPGPGEVTVTLAACGVCGTDLEKLRGNYRTAGVIGHEPVGRVARVGDGVRDLSVGDRVFVHHHVPCYGCEVCARGDYTFCPTYSKTNIDPGGFADTFRVPRENVARKAVLKLDASVDWDTGALLEPAGCAFTAIRKVGWPERATVLILGLGPVGLLYARLARALGAEWVGGTEVSALRRKAAERGGIDVAIDPRDPAPVRTAVDAATKGRGVDLAVVATGHPSVAKTATELVRRGGTVNLFGLPESGSRLDADLQDLYLRGVRIVPSYATTEPDLIEVHRLVVEGKFSVSDLVTHRLPLEQIAEAFRLASRPEEAVKVTVTGAAFAQGAGSRSA
jgi:L-iditol 2-dehydrogenase